MPDCVRNRAVKPGRGMVGRVNPLSQLKIGGKKVIGKEGKEGVTPECPVVLGGLGTGPRPGALARGHVGCVRGDIFREDVSATSIDHVGEVVDLLSQSALVETEDAVGIEVGEGREQAHERGVTLSLGRGKEGVLKLEEDIVFRLKSPGGAGQCVWWE